MPNFRSVFKCKAPCHCYSRASGTSHSPQRGRSLTANLTWNCSLTEGLSLFYRWRLGLNFFLLALWHQGSWWFREWDWSLVSAICLSANVKGKISFCLAESVGHQSDEESPVDLLCGEGEDKEICQELPINTSETPCFLLHHERALSCSSSFNPVESHKSHIHKESWSFWLPSPSKPTRYWWGYFAVFGCI